MAEFRHPNFETDRIVDKYYSLKHEVIMKKICQQIKAVNVNMKEKKVKRKALNHLHDIKEQSSIAVKKQEAAERRPFSIRIRGSEPKYLTKGSQMHKYDAFKKLPREPKRNSDMLKFCLLKTTVQRLRETHKSKEADSNSV